MKCRNNVFAFVFLTLIITSCVALMQESKDAKAFIKAGDYDSAVLCYKKALDSNAGNKTLSHLQNPQESASKPPSVVAATRITTTYRSGQGVLQVAHLDKVIGRGSDHGR